MQSTFRFNIFQKTRMAFAFAALCLVVGQGIAPAEAQSRGSLPGAAPRLIYVQDFNLDNPGRDAEGRELVELMAAFLVQDLNKAGYQAKRLRPGETAPHTGFLLGGAFTELKKGNRAKRTLIGFGSGAAKVELYVTVTDVSNPNHEPLYSTSARKTSGKWPGAIMMPSLTPVKFVLTRNDAQKTVKKVAAKIVAQLSDALNENATARAADPTTTNSRGNL